MAEHTLFLMRHAQAADKQPGGGDHDRALTAAGRSEAEAAGEALRTVAGTIDHVLCSSAARTRETLTALQLDAPSEFTDEMYNAGDDTLLEIVQRQDESVGSLLLVGHAPGIPGLAGRLTGPGSDPEASATQDSRFPTATVAQFEVTDPWQDLNVARLTRLRLGH